MDSIDFHILNTWANVYLSQFLFILRTKSFVFVSNFFYYSKLPKNMEKRRITE